MTGWTVDTLHEHITALFREKQTAIDRVAKDIDSRFATTNEWRATVNDVLNRALPRETYEQAHEVLRQVAERNRLELAEHRVVDAREIGDLKEAVASLRAKFVGATAALATAMTVLVALVAILRINA